MIKINKLAIEQVIVCDKQPDWTIEWCDEEKSFFGLFKEEGGFYDWIFKNKKYDIDGLKSGEYGGIKRLIEDKKVYFRPYVKVKMVSGDSKIIGKFNTYKEALDRANTFISENNLDCKFIKI